MNTHRKMPAIFDTLGTILLVLLILLALGLCTTEVVTRINEAYDNRADLACAHYQAIGQDWKCRVPS